VHTISDFERSSESVDLLSRSDDNVSHALGGGANELLFGNEYTNSVPPLQRSAANLNEDKIFSGESGWAVEMHGLKHSVTSAFTDNFLDLKEIKLTHRIVFVKVMNVDFMRTRCPALAHAMHDGIKIRDQLNAFYGKVNLNKRQYQMYTVRRLVDFNILILAALSSVSGIYTITAIQALNYALDQNSCHICDQRVMGAPLTKRDAFIIAGGSVAPFDSTSDFQGKVVIKSNSTTHVLFVADHEMSMHESLVQYVAMIRQIRKRHTHTGLALGPVFLEVHTNTGRQHCHGRAELASGNRPMQYMRYKLIQLWKNRMYGSPLYAYQRPNGAVVLDIPFFTVCYDFPIGRGTPAFILPPKMVDCILAFLYLVHQEPSMKPSPDKDYVKIASEFDDAIINARRFMPYIHQDLAKFGIFLLPEDIYRVIADHPRYQPHLWGYCNGKVFISSPYYVGVLKHLGHFDDGVLTLPSSAAPYIVRALSETSRVYLL
jgi:hypothetical protein